MDTEVTHPGPLTVELEGTPVDIVQRIEWDPDEGLYRWLAPDRWHYLPVEREALLEVATGIWEAVDPQGRRWTFRPVAQSDHVLVYPVPDPPPADFPRWLARKLKEMA